MMEVAVVAVTLKLMGGEGTVSAQTYIIIDGEFEL